MTAAEAKVDELVEAVKIARQAAVDLHSTAIIAHRMSGKRQDEIKIQAYQERLDYFDAILANYDAALGAKP